MESELVEVRIPTYKRPKWLAHALQSLLNQDFSNWTAIVFDDSIEREGEEIVRKFNDSRLIYRPNPKNLGASPNLNQCFRNAPYAGGTYAFILEDDNWLLPDFISANLEAMKDAGVNIVHRNQEIWSREDDGMRKMEGTTLGHKYPGQRMTPVQMHAHTFFWPEYLMAPCTFALTQDRISKCNLPNPIQACRSIFDVSPSGKTRYSLQNQKQCLHGCLFRIPHDTTQIQNITQPMYERYNAT